MKRRARVYLAAFTLAACCAGLIVLFAVKPDETIAFPRHNQPPTGNGHAEESVSSRDATTPLPATTNSTGRADKDGHTGTLEVAESFDAACDPDFEAAANNPAGENNAPEKIAAFKEQLIRQRFGAICRQDKWIPTVCGGTNLVYITTGSLAAGQVGKLYEAQFLATSGFPPYSWSIVGGELPESFAFDPYSGILTGVALEPATTKLFIEVTDSRGAKDIAEYNLTFQPEQSLEISTESLPAVFPGATYAVQLQATGGIPPYYWSASGDIGTNGTLVLDGQTGQLSVQIATGSSDVDIPLVFCLSDSQLQVSKELVLHVRSALSILNAPSSSVYEADSVEFQFQATGGAEPYVWGIDGGLPPGIAFSQTGLFSGQPAEAGSYTLNTWVQDEGGQCDTVQFTFEVLPLAETVSDFQALLSRNSVALSWKLPASRDNLSVRIVKSATGTPATPSDGVTLCYGTLTAYLDSDAGAGSHYYAAFLEEAGVTVTGAPPATLCALLPPETDPFADKVTSKNLLHANAFRIADLPQVVLGAPRGTGLAAGSADVVSLGAAINNDAGASAPYGGTITLEFTDNLVWDGPGVDFTIFENVFYVYNDSGVLDPETRFMEPAVVSVSQDGINWRQFPIDFSPRYDPESGELNLRHPYCYNSGFAGVNPVMSNGNDPDPTDPDLSGGDSFDIGALGLDWIRYVSIQSVGSRWLTDKDGEVVYHTEEMGAATRSNNKSGFDLDAVTAIWMEKISASK